MLRTVTVSRTFTGGTLAGLTIEQSFTLDASRAGKVGDTFECRKPVGGSPYIDTTTKIA